MSDSGLSRVLALSVRFPFGNLESFFEAELDGLSQSCEVWMAPTASVSGLALRPLRLADRVVVPEARFRPQFFVDGIRPVLVRPARRTLRTLYQHRVVESLIETMKNLGIEHLHGLWAGLPASIAMAASNHYSIPWSFSAHRGDVVQGWDLVRKMNSATFVRCISEDTVRLLREALGSKWTPAMADKVLIAPLCVEVIDPANVISMERRGRAVVVPANLIRIKGHDTLIRAVKLLRDRGFEQPVVFAGDGELRGELTQHVNDLGVDDLIRFAGVVPHAELIEQLRSGLYRAVVLPSRDLGNGQHEGVPVAILEAMANGINVVSTPTGGIAASVEGCARLFEGDSAEELARILVDFEDDPAGADRLRDAALELAMSRYSAKGAHRELSKALSNKPYGS